MFEIKGKHTVAKVMIDDVDQTTIKQLTIMANHPSATEPIAIMPDCHAGKGCVVGFTMKAGTKVVPNFIGVDIGCGLLSVNTGLTSLSDGQLAAFDKELRKTIPMGAAVNEHFDNNLRNRFYRMAGVNEAALNELIDKTAMKDGRFWNSIGSMGGGNHYFEGGIDETGNIWITVHSGSRNFGKRVCEYFDEIAQARLKNGAADDYLVELKRKADKKEINKKDIGHLYAQFKSEHKATFDVKESSYLEGENLKSYLSAMKIAQQYAVLNRQVMIERVLELLGKQLNKNLSKPVESIETIHNYISPEDGMIRKGAVASYIGRKMVIPFNMRDGMLICEGKSNPEWNFSAPHGAGRVLSRSQAKDKLRIEDYQESMKGIFTTSVNMGTLDESPMAYKDAAMIEAAIEPTAKIINRVKPIYNVKASE